MKSEEIGKLIAELDQLAEEIVSINSRSLWDEGDIDVNATPDEQSESLGNCE